MLKQEDILQREKLSLLLYMKYRKFLSVTEFAGIAKNSSNAEEKRKMGNELYKSRPHNSSIHENIWNLYSQSILLAPNDSEDLAAGYGNRSALFFHIKKYKECITDVDKALSITSNNVLKVKLLCRKAESLMMLNEPIKLVCEEAMQIIEQFQKSEKNIYAAKLNQLLVKKNTKIKSNNKLLKKDNCIHDIHDLLNFERSKEIPAASKSVAIKYNKEWGRHVVAAEDIKPGEIISVQKSCFTRISNEKMNFFCSYCTVIAYNSIPCEFCIYSNYCSEACRTTAWEEYHQYECVIHQHIKIPSESFFFTRFVLSAIHEVGSIDQMKEFILEIENTIDPRIKGFSNGIFYAEQKKNLYSLNTKYFEEYIDYKMNYALCSDICNYIYILSKFTNFFGQKTNVKESELLLNEDRLFIAALILKTAYIINTNFQTYILKGETTRLAINCELELFSNLINHSCHNNVKTVRLNGGKNIMFACHPIKKGSQLFKSFHGMQLCVPKKLRQDAFESSKITCQCIACKEDWSSISIPSIEQFYQITPTLDVSILKRNRILLELINHKHGISRFTRNLLNDVCHHLAELAEKITVVCADYHIFLEFIEDLIYQTLSEYYFEMPAQCE